MKQKATAASNTEYNRVQISFVRETRKSTPHIEERHSE